MKKTLINCDNCREPIRKDGFNYSYYEVKQYDLHGGEWHFCKPECLVNYIKEQHINPKQGKE